MEYTTVAEPDFSCKVCGNEMFAAEMRYDEDSSHITVCLICRQKCMSLEMVINKKNYRNITMTGLKDITFNISNS